MIGETFTKRAAWAGFWVSLFFAGLGYGFHSAGMGLGILSGGTLAVLNLRGLGWILGLAFRPGFGESENPKGSAGLVYVSFIVRYGLLIPLLGALVYFRWVHPLGIVIGLGSVLVAFGATIVKSYDFLSGKTAV